MKRYGLQANKNDNKTHQVTQLRVEIRKHIYEAFVELKHNKTTHQVMNSCTMVGTKS